MAKKRTRKAIMDTASELFHKQGYNATGINQIIDESGVAKSTLYQHFRSKEDICLCYLNETDERWKVKFTSFYEISDDPRELILMSFDFLKEWLIGDNYRGCVFLNIISELADANKKVSKAVLEHKTWLRKFFQEEAAKLTGVPASFGDVVFILFEGALIESQVHRDTHLVDCARETVSKMMG
ncbi:TetR/AcrR family transcriptional regulator [Fulvivirgaceae bacterium BMA10]|uniref:TetR/AcrR family transcriptional regulator n=1 Tax=Splendidivirga corallicola TaxID=3051826 RepID=A0ABT8KSK9_9BACT|nr:TetR/AcrR family transcriptional regulator [Fulvivirgaceae bacterium BMA10]